MASPYDRIIDSFKKLDINDDGIILNHKLKTIEQVFREIIVNEETLNEAMEYINDAVIQEIDSSVAQKYAILISSRTFDFFAMDNTKVRYKMIGLLQKNFENADELRNHHRVTLYNSITLLGEYYHRIRQNGGNVITDLGSALIELLRREVIEYSNNTKIADIRLAKLILSQLTLNGRLFQVAHKDELNQLLFHIRLALIEIPNLESCVKALLMMSIDLIHNKFMNLGENLENMYAKHLINAELFVESEDLEIARSRIQAHLSNSIIAQQDQVNIKEDELQIEIPQQDKKWSEQVDEEENQNEDYTEILFSSRHSNDNYDDISHGGSNPSIYENDDDKSVRSEGGSLKLYSVKDRINMSKTYDRSLSTSRKNNNNNNQRYHHQRQDSPSVPWNGRYHAYDRNRGGSMRNAQGLNNNDNHFGANMRNPSSYNQNNRQHYDRPPRFSKQNQQSQQNSGQTSWRNQVNQDNERQESQQQQVQQLNYPKDDEIRAVSESRMMPRNNVPSSQSRNYRNFQPRHMRNNYQRAERANSYEPNDQQSYDNFSNRNSNVNLNKNRNHNGNANNEGNRNDWSNSHRRRQSIDQGEFGETEGRPPVKSGKDKLNYDNRNLSRSRYGSQSSLASSDKAGWQTVEKRGRRGSMSKENKTSPLRQEYYQSRRRNNRNHSIDDTDDKSSVTSATYDKHNRRSPTSKERRFIPKHPNFSNKNKNRIYSEDTDDKSSLINATFEKRNLRSPTLKEYKNRNSYNRNHTDDNTENDKSNMERRDHQNLPSKDHNTNLRQQSNNYHKNNNRNHHNDDSDEKSSVSASVGRRNRQTIPSKDYKKGPQHSDNYQNKNKNRRDSIDDDNTDKYSITTNLDLK